MLKRSYVWEWPVRITHWVNFVCIVMLALTGLLIGSPVLEPPPEAPFTMGWVRLLHFSFGYAFALSVLARLIWLAFGNRHANWRAYLSLLTRAGRRSGWQAFKYYAFLTRRTPYAAGHNGLAAAIYLGIFLLFLIEIASGLTLYGQYAPGGFWNWLTAPLLGVLNIQYIRLTHHVILWLIVTFLIVHVYLSWMLDRKMKNGLMSSIFGGYKFIDPERVID